MKAKSGAPGKLTLFSFEANQNQALIYENRGFEVCFGGLDDLMAELLNNSPSGQLVLSVSNDPLDVAPQVHPVTIDVGVAKTTGTAELEKMFNGRAASYADISRGWTFARTISSQLETQLAAASRRISYVIGSAGVGKTTAVRQTLCRLVERDVRCFEHKPDFRLPVDAWISVDKEFRKRKQCAVLFIDDAHDHLRDVNRLVEAISIHAIPALKVVLTSSRPHWNPRLKSPAIFSQGTEYNLSSLDQQEISSLLELLDGRPEISALVENQFLGFSRVERRRRLTDRCSADMFVCLKHIFGFQSIDNIILQEYASLQEDYQEIYRHIAAMEAAGVRVHRQLVIRTIGLEAQNVRRILDDLKGIIDEYTVSERDGVYGWSIRHPVIATLISKYKFSSPEEFYELLDRIISNLNPSYTIEVRSLEEMCDIQAGIGKIPDKARQNVLLRKMISLAPKLNVPRHRLITNLIALEQFEVAESEIRIFEKELRRDGPVQRYKVMLKVALADKTAGIMASDRAALALEAVTLAEGGLEYFSEDKNMYRSYLDAALAHYRHSGNGEVFERAMERAREAQSKILDPEFRRVVSIMDRAADRMLVRGG